MTQPSKEAIAAVRATIPSAEIISRFGAVLAMSPELYSQTVANFSKEYGTEREATTAYIEQVLATIEPL